MVLCLYHAVVRVFIIQLAKYSTSWRVLSHSLSIAPPYFSRMANDKCEILLPIHCRHEGVEVGGSLLYLFYRLPIYLQTNLESQRSQVYFAAWLVLLAGYIERILYWLCDCRKPSNFVWNHSRGFNAGLITRHGQISPFFQEKGREGEVPYKSSTPEIINCLLDIWKHTTTISGLYLNQNWRKDGSYLLLRPFAFCS